MLRTTEVNFGLLTNRVNKNTDIATLEERLKAELAIVGGLA